MQSADIPVIKTASIHWNERGQPVSDHYDDIYFSSESGLEETRHTFIAQNHLQERFAALAAGQHLVVGETGFGTGLNFLCTWQCFNQHAPAGARLHFISTEKHPLSVADLKKALSLWPELSEHRTQLVNHYPSMVGGQHRLVFDNGRVVLTLLFGDVLETLPKLEATVDAWFLDGFAPARNPDMWCQELFRLLARKSSSEATCATFTVARIVRDGLQNAGFAVEKVLGFGRKRDIVRGSIKHSGAIDEQPVWFRIPKPASSGKQALIIGAGMAGAATARALAERGWQVRVIDAHPQPACEASGNPQGMLYTRLSGSSTVLSRFITQGYLYTLNLLKRLESQQASEQTLWKKTGLIQLAFSVAEQQRQQRIIQSGQFPKCFLEPLDAEALSSLAGLPLTTSGLYFPDGGWVHPPALCHLLLDHPNIRFTGGLSLIRLTHQGNRWHTEIESGVLLMSNIVVMACGHLSTKLAQTQHLPLKSIRGQITQLPETSISCRLNTVVCGGGCIAPAWNNMHTLGATFNFNDDSTDCRQRDHETNLRNLATCTPAIYDALALSDVDTATLGGRVSFRCTTPDYLPVVGPVADAEVFRNHFAALRKNAKQRFTDSPSHLPGLYITTGHGSRGLVTAPLSAEILTSYICDEPSPVPRDQRHGLHPSRFMVRDLIKNLT